MGNEGLLGIVVVVAAAAAAARGYYLRRVGWRCCS